MPLTEPLRTLDTSPRSVQDARRWVASACHELGRDDLVESAALGISELVTNALLHAVPPIRVQLRGTAQHPRIEVSDGSAVPPVPAPRKGDEDLLTTIGRGLTLVARCSHAWGSYVQHDGKTVWFEPAPSITDRPEVRGQINEAPRSDRHLDRVGPDEGHQVALLNFPVQQHAAWSRHFLDLQRELRLLALAHETAYPVARHLSALFTAFTDEVRRARGFDDLVTTAATSIDLRVQITSEAPAVTARMIEVLDVAEDFCRAERMLTPPTSADALAFQHWFLRELVNQPAGAAPTPWSGGPARDHPRDGQPQS